MFLYRFLIFPLFFALAAMPATGQTNVAFGGIKADPTLPVEVTADSLDVNQADGSAEFKGNVRIGQGEMRISAQRVLVIYNQDQSTIQRMEAVGDVVLVSFPFTNLKTTKKRPAVIISSEAYQSYRPDLVIMALTSQITESSRQRRVKRRGIFAGNKKASLRELA